VIPLFVGREASIKAITRADITAFHQTYFKPGRALITVVGDVTPATVRPVIERALAAWARGGGRPSYPPLPAPKPTTIYLVDRPGHAQSTFAIGLHGPSRMTPDYYALQVMNTILGGMFLARLNANIREEKGYSYGVGSGFGFGKGPAPFRTGGDIVGDKTDAALVEFMKELRGMVGARPVTAEELRTAKESLVQRLPGAFASVGAISARRLWVQGLPDTYYQELESRGGDQRRGRAPRQNISRLDRLARTSAMPRLKPAEGHRHYRSSLDIEGDLVPDPSREAAVHGQSLRDVAITERDTCSDRRSHRRRRPERRCLGDRTGCLAGLSARQNRRQLHAQLLFPAGAERHTMGAGVGAGRHLDRCCDERLDLEGRSRHRRGP
jgi:hypothetical protein